jgi:hypothetical protein
VVPERRGGRDGWLGGLLTSGQICFLIGLETDEKPLALLDEGRKRNAQGTGVKAVNRRRRRDQAEQIARDLFTNGQGERAERLVLTVDGPPAENLGGWSETAMIERIEQTLERFTLSADPLRAREAKS